MNELSVITTKDVEGKLITLRNQKVLLDCDVADLYGVKTKEINQAVKTIQTSSLMAIFLCLISTRKQRWSKLYMLATIIKSPRATKTTLAIVDTFVTVRELANTMERLQNVQDGGKQQQQLLKHSGELMADMIGNNLSTTTAETEIELNFAVVKIKHKIVRKDEK